MSESLPAFSDETPIASYTFEGMTSKAVKYTGPMHKARPFLKWLMIAYLVVILGISTLILHEMTIVEFLRMSILPFTLLVWLIKTRQRRVEIAEPIELYFYSEHFSLVKPMTPVKNWRKEVPCRDVFSMRYKDATKIRHDLELGLVIITGRLHSEFFDYAGEARQGVRPRHEKVVNQAAAFWYTCYMDPEMNEEILGRMSEYTGVDVSLLGRRRDRVPPERAEWP